MQCKSLLFFQQKNWPISDVLFEILTEMLTNKVISCEQPGPDFSWFCKLQKFLEVQLKGTK